MLYIILELKMQNNTTTKHLNKTNMGKVYISGRITGIEEEAPQLFDKAEIKLLEDGYEVVNPMKLNHQHDKSWHSYMREDIKALCDCDTIYMLSNWKESKGAIIEMEIACHLGLKVIYEGELKMN
jgi:hypothetical protein